MLTKNQKQRLTELKEYVREVEEVEKSDFDQWFKGKQTVCVNIGAWLLLCAAFVDGTK